jgi:hypothetical protein
MMKWAQILRKEKYEAGLDFDFLRPTKAPHLPYFNES